MPKIKRRVFHVPTDRSMMNFLPLAQPPEGYAFFKMVRHGTKVTATFVRVDAR